MQHIKRFCVVLQKKWLIHGWVESLVLPHSDSGKRISYLITCVVYCRHRVCKPSFLSLMKPSTHMMSLAFHRQKIHKSPIYYYGQSFALFSVHFIFCLKSLTEIQYVFVSTLSCTHCLYDLVSLIITFCHKVTLYRCGWGEGRVRLEWTCFLAEREGSHGKQRRVVMGVYPML